MNKVENETGSLGGRVVSGLVWSSGEKVLATGVSFIVSLILARLVLPDEYGIVSILTVFINISNVFVEGGFGLALVQKKNADDLDFNSVFLFQLTMSLLLYSLLYICSPYIAQWYKIPELRLVLRIYGFTVVLAAVKNIQHAYVQKKMQFKKFFYSTLGGTIVSAFVGVAMAYSGYGVWALVAQVMVNSFIDSLVLFCTIDWKPKLVFSMNRLKGLYSFGWKLFGTNILSTVYNNIYGLIIGKIYNTEALALYNKGNAFPTLISNNVTGPIQNVTFPALSIAQSDKIRLKNMTKKTLMITTYVIWPLLIGMACVGDAMINVLLTEKWKGCVIFLQIGCIGSAFWPISSANGMLINAIGRSDISLKLDALKKVIGISVLLLSLPFGVTAMALGRAVVLLLAAIIDALPNKRNINYSILEQIKDLFPNAIAVSIMAMSVLYVKHAFNSQIVVLVVQVSVGVCVYLIVSKVMRLQGLKYTLEYMENLLKRKA